MGETLTLSTVTLPGVPQEPHGDRTVLGMTSKTTDLGSLLPEATSIPGHVLRSSISQAKVYVKIPLIKYPNLALELFFSIRVMNIDLDLSQGP